MNQPEISIIIPVYKVEKYLNCCLDSVLSQTFSDFEVILVDDGSPDNCGKICDEYAKKDPRFCVIHKENGGISDARNAGLKVAIRQKKLLSATENRLLLSCWRGKKWRLWFAINCIGKNFFISILS